MPSAGVDGHTAVRRKRPPCSAPHVRDAPLSSSVGSWNAKVSKTARIKAASVQDVNDVALSKASTPSTTRITGNFDVLSSICIRTSEARDIRKTCLIGFRRQPPRHRQISTWCWGMRLRKWLLPRMMSSNLGNLVCYNQGGSLLAPHRRERRALSPPRRCGGTMVRSAPIPAQAGHSDARADDAFPGLSFPVIKSLISLNRVLLPGAGSWFVTAEALSPRFVLAATMMLALRGPREEDAPPPGKSSKALGSDSSPRQAPSSKPTACNIRRPRRRRFSPNSTLSLMPGRRFALRRRRDPGAIIWVGCALVLLGVGILGRFEWPHAQVWKGRVGVAAPEFDFLHGTDPVDREKGICRQPAVLDHVRHVRDSGGDFPRARRRDGSRGPFARGVAWQSHALESASP